MHVFFPRENSTIPHFYNAIYSRGSEALWKKEGPGREGAGEGRQGGLPERQPPPGPGLPNPQAQERIPPNLSPAAQILGHSSLPGAEPLPGSIYLCPQAISRRFSAQCLKPAFLEFSCGQLGG